MAFKTQNENQETMSEINVTPLVDVMLVLVIILLVTAPLLTQSVHVTLPKTAEATANVAEQPLQLEINPQGQIILNKNPVDSLALLEAILQKELIKNHDVALHLYADENVRYGKVAEVMAAVQHAGISRIAFVTIEK